MPFSMFLVQGEADAGADYFRQLIARIYRGGQTKVTNTVCVCAERTVEELVYERLFAKETRMDDLLELLRLRRA